MANVTIKVTPNSDVNAGDNITLTCQYAGVTNPKTLEVTWKLGKPGRDIWVYDGALGTDTGRNVSNHTKLSSVKGSIVKEHSIKVQNVQLTDDGIYTCDVVIYESTYLRDTALKEIVVIGIETLILYYIF